MLICADTDLIANLEALVRDHLFRERNQEGRRDAGNGGLPVVLVVPKSLSPWTARRFPVCHKAHPVDSIHSVAIECCSKLVERLDSPVVPARELVVSVPAHRRDARPHEDAELVNEVLVGPRIALCNFFGNIGEVVLDRPTLARPDVYEERSPPGAKQVSRMRLTVQQLLAGSPTANRRAHAPECVAEQFAVTIAKFWSQLTVANPLCPTGDSSGDVWCRQIDLAQAGVEPDECVRIVRRCEVCGHAELLVRHAATPVSNERLVVGP